MIRKLMKYELLATGRLYLPLYLAMLGFALLGRLTVWRIPWQVTTGEDAFGWNNFSVTAGAGFFDQLLGFLVAMVLVFYLLTVLGAVVVHFIITLQRFWKNLLGDEGYLMFTLPVTAGELLWSKALCAFLWGIATALALLLSFLLLLWHPGLVLPVKQAFAAIGPEEWALIGRVLRGVFPPLLWSVLLAVALVDGVGSLFLLYAAMAIGHTVKNHKVLASVGAYGVITTVVGVAASLAVMPLLPVLMRGVEVPDLPSTQAMLLFSHQLGEYLTSVMVIALVLDLLVSAGSFFLARYLLNTQLNLE